ncbi:hypothetical protein BC940DRAFT_306403 [Gongronella butleri]|nr:hypothetical protein BC940DRAFT_306403 [Gongronella butleri]
MLQHIHFLEKHPPLKRHPLKRFEVPISSISELGDPQLDHVLEVFQVEGTNEQTINYDASSLQSVFDLICELKHPETYAPLSHKNDLKPLASRAIELIDKSINRIIPFAANELQIETQMSLVQIYEEPDDSLCPILRTMLQIALSLRMAKTICEYEAGKIDSCYQYYTIRRLFRRLFQHPAGSKSVFFKPVVLADKLAPFAVPFDGFLSHCHPAIMGAAVFVLVRHSIAIRQVHLCALVVKNFETVTNPDDLHPALICMHNEWHIGGCDIAAFDERITIHGFRTSIRWHWMIVLALFFGGVAFVVLINTLNRNWVNSVGVDPTSMLSLIIVLVGILTTAMKAAFVENWSWFDFLRGRYYKTRIGESEIVNVARIAIKATVNQMHLFNKNGFSYVSGSTKDGPIVTDIPVNSAQLARYGAIVVWNNKNNPNVSNDECIVFCTGNNRVCSLIRVGVGRNRQKVVDAALDTVGVILSTRTNILLR